ncbi:hypothetical protein LCGC14_0645460 [marine sediment metagenome]|uniref:PET hydrolase/cutinase-like domain-containing protein n=1 Tax=marine sediment metagenome TaxID=412755 RepID=A0A0F9TJJ0_9ZZZZ|nr:MAG: Alpha/beta hydrolase family protein [Candidatus Lokiarchaeum sp. GC14_75]
MSNDNLNYDPFIRGPFPVGVLTENLTDSERNRNLPIEIWYPALEKYTGQDLVEETQDEYELFAQKIKQDAVREAQLREGCYPLIMFSHGFSGHRRQTTHFCTHLASHGYVVASVDHTGNTMMDLIQNYIANQSGASSTDMETLGTQSAYDRPLDIKFAIDCLLKGETLIPTNNLDSSKIGMTGHSFGGWTTLVMPSIDKRIKATLPLAPGGGNSGEASIITLGDQLNWDHEVPTLYLVGEGDVILPLKGMYDLFNRTKEPKRMVILKNADHFHFNDRIEQTHEFFRNQASIMRSEDATGLSEKMRPVSELCPAEKAYSFIRGLGLAHMDAFIQKDLIANQFITNGLKASLTKRKIDAKIV